MEWKLEVGEEDLVSALIEASKDARPAGCTSDANGQKTAALAGAVEGNECAASQVAAPAPQAFFQAFAKLGHLGNMGQPYQQLQQAAAHQLQQIQQGNAQLDPQKSTQMQQGLMHLLQQIQQGSAQFDPQILAQMHQRIQEGLSAL